MCNSYWLHPRFLQDPYACIGKYRAIDDRANFPDPDTAVVDQTVYSFVIVDHDHL